MKTPIVLESNLLTVPPGTSLKFDQQSLRNPFQAGMWVDEINFFIGGVAGVGAEFRTKIQFGNVLLTNGYVPIWTLGKVTNPYWSGQVTASGQDQWYSWRLPRPLYIRPGTNIEIYAQQVPVGQGGSSAGTKTVRVSFVGRSGEPGDPIPSKIEIPWVTSFVSAGKVAGANYIETITEASLVNPFDVPVYVQRLVGRIIERSAGNVSRDEFRAQAEIFAQTTIRLVDSKGAIVARDLTPWASLFAFPDRAWEARTILKPKQFFRGEIKENYLSSTAGSTFYPMISLIGYREVTYV